MTVSWEDPPESALHDGREGMATSLQGFVDNPGQWGRLSDFHYKQKSSAHSAKSRIVTKTLSNQPGQDGTWECVVGQLDDDRWHLWVRYLKPGG